MEATCSSERLRNQQRVLLRIIFAIAVLSNCQSSPFANAAGTQDNIKAGWMTSCFTGRDCLSKRTSWKAAIVGNIPGCLDAVRVWWSAQPPGLPVTLVTQLSTDRIQQLRAQCAAWDGPLAAAVYLPLLNQDRVLTPENRKQLVTELQRWAAFYNEAEDRLQNKGGGCQLRLLLLYEMYSEEHAVLLYPYNTLRNFARLMADTDLIAHVDVDMVPSASLKAELSDQTNLAAYTAGCRDQSAVYIWPSFEAGCGSEAYADQVAKGGKAAVEAALKDSKSCLRLLRAHASSQLQGPIHYNQWLASTNVFNTSYAARNEPYFLSWRWNTQWFDYRYRGYGFDKLSHAVATNASRASWRVSPTGFLVHRRHNSTAAKNLWQFHNDKVNSSTAFGANHDEHKQVAARQKSLIEHNQRLFYTIMRDMMEGRALNVALEPLVQTCMQSLPWWKRS